MEKITVIPWLFIIATILFVLTSFNPQKIFKYPKLTLSLTELRIHVKSLLDKPVSGADIKINCFNYELSNSTGSEDIAYFYGVLGQVSWGINATYTATLGSLDFTVMNNTQTVLIDEDNGNMTIELPMNNLRVTAVDLLGEVVEEYTAYLYYGTEPLIKVDPLLIPKTKFLASVISGIVSAVGTSDFVPYRYYSVPKAVRVLNKIINRIEKGERIPLDVVSGIRSRRDIIDVRVAKWCKSLGIKFSTREEGEKGG